MKPIEPLTDEDMARIARARDERARHETESYNEARYQLALLGFYGEYITYALDAARAQGSLMTSGVHVARVEYRLGVYSVTP